LESYPTTEKSNFMDNLFANLPADTSLEQIEPLLESATVRIERIVSHGQSTAADDWYDQDENEWVVLLKGEAELRFAGDEELLTMHPGNFIHIPAHRRHRVESTAADQPTIWLAIFYVSQKTT